MAANAAALSSVARQRFLSPPPPPANARRSVSSKCISASFLPANHSGNTHNNSTRWYSSHLSRQWYSSHLSRQTHARGGAGPGRGWAAVASAALEDPDVIPLRSGDATDQQEGLALVGAQEEEVVSGNNQVGGFAFEGGAASFGGDVGVGFSSSAASSSSSSPPPMAPIGEDFGRMVDRTINATIVLAAGTAAITKLLTIDHDYWHGWTLYEILRYAPQHNWTAYEEALKTNPVLAKMMISGIVYSLGDWIAQCYEGKPLFEFDRARMFRSGLVGFTLHGSLSHYYYHLCEALFPFQDWWVVPAKVAFDQTIWSAVWNSIYYVVLGILRLEPPGNILGELKATFWPMLKAGWKLWPFAHLITYGVIPVEQRLLWVDCVELVWVTILSTYSNEKSEARSSAAISETKAKSS